MADRETSVATVIVPAPTASQDGHDLPIPGSGDPHDAVKSPASGRSQMAAALLAQLQAKKFGRDARLHPEIRKVLERALMWLRALDEAVDIPAVETALLDVRARHSWVDVPRPSEEQAWALTDDLQALWVRYASPEALRAEVAARRRRPAKDATDDQVRAYLRRLFMSLQSTGAHQRAYAAMRARYLRNAGVVLVIAVTLSLVLGQTLPADSGTLIMCALAGLVGGLIAGTMRLRDSKSMLDIRVMQTWWWVQPAVGAAFGMLMFALLESPVLSLPGSDAVSDAAQKAALVVYAFLAGFSEPWLLRVLDRLGGAASDAPDPAADRPDTKPTTPREDELDPATKSNANSDDPIAPATGGAPSSDGSNAGDR